MRLQAPASEIHIPDALSWEAAASRITHLGIGAHSDDLEFMAFHGIAACYHSSERWFGGITCTDGAGSARTGKYKEISTQEFVELRRAEQNRAADLGAYGIMVQLAYASQEIRGNRGSLLEEDLVEILRVCHPDVVYTHNLADKHPTHVAVGLAAIRAIRKMPADSRPGEVYGCEGWRDLDWLPDSEKVVLDLGGNETLANDLNGIFESQIAGGKRYDLAVQGRRRANATFLEPRTADQMKMATLAMDLTPLIADPALDIAGYVLGAIDRFAGEAREGLVQGQSK